jgi:hypothetical protein
LLTGNFEEVKSHLATLAETGKSQFEMLMAEMRSNKKSKTDANFEITAVNSRDSNLNRLRRSSVDNGVKFKFNESTESGDEDEDDIFVTPSSTPTNEKIGKESVLNASVSEANLENNLYSIYDLYLIDLQTIIGKKKCVGFVLFQWEGFSTFF